jgi:hypothetical protein
LPCTNCRTDCEPLYTRVDIVAVPMERNSDMDALVNSHIQRTRGTVRNRGEHGVLCRPSYLFMTVLLLVVFVATFLTESIEININLKKVDGSGDSKPESSEAKKATSPSSKPSTTGEDANSYENEVASGKFSIPNVEDDPANADNSNVERDVDNILDSTVPGGGSTSEEVPVSPSHVDEAVVPETLVQDTVVDNLESISNNRTPVSTGDAPSKSPTFGAEDLPPGFKKHPSAISDVYVRRGKPLDDAEKAKLADTWGSWTFVDQNANNRPSADFYADYPHRDIPFDKIPETSWQKDPAYLASFLPEAQALVERAMEAILAEYGHSKFDEPQMDFEKRSDMFSLTMLDLEKGEKFPKTASNAGCTTKRSFDGLVRRILHAIMSEDTFNFVMGGHSSAAGHGNHFQQSYTLQFQKVMEPIFARLGVKLTSRNIGMGGLGTLHNSLGAGSIYGSELDILMWDSGMTERGAPIVDLFSIQGMIGGSRVPFIIAEGSLAELHTHAGADVGKLGTGMRGIQKTDSVKTLEQIPWAARYMDCSPEMRTECGNNKYRGTCWIHRPDFNPKLAQKAVPGGRANWHPGDRSHQLEGRVLAFLVLRAIKQALDLWASAENYRLPDEYWHVAGYYQSIRSKLISLNPAIGGCHQNEGIIQRACSTAMKSRTEFTPRNNPSETSIRSILKGNYDFKILPNVYDPPDVFVPDLSVPDGVFEYLAVVENGEDFQPELSRVQRFSSTRRLKSTHHRSLANPSITPGKGWFFTGNSAPDNCDGTYDSFCGRSQDNPCLLYGHNDGRSGLLFDSLSGWLIMDLVELKEGIIILKIEDWHGAKSNKATEGWRCENGSAECSGRRLSSAIRRGNYTSTQLDRNLKAKPPEYCEKFVFEYAIDGKVTQMKKDEFMKKMIQAQRVVQLWVLLDDPNFSSGDPKDVELAFRITGCGREKTMHLTHVYWA